MTSLSSTWNPSGKLFIGIGNPGTECEHTYHNIGAQTLLFLSGTNRDGFVHPSRKHFLYVNLPARPSAEKLNLKSPIFALNETFMNESGIAVREALAYFKKKPEQLVILHDDSDMTLGTFKFSFNQRSAGHHGVDSIIAEVGSSEFYRLKIGVRPKEELVRKKAEAFVLKKISSADQKQFEEVFEKIRTSLGL